MSVRNMSVGLFSSPAACEPSLGNPKIALWEMLFKQNSRAFKTSTQGPLTDKQDPQARASEDQNFRKYLCTRALGGLASRLYQISKRERTAIADPENIVEGLGTCAKYLKALCGHNKEIDGQIVQSELIRQTSKRIMSVQAFKTFDTLLDFIKDVPTRKPRIPNLEETKFGFGRNIYIYMLMFILCK